MFGMATECRVEEVIEWLDWKKNLKPHGYSRFNYFLPKPFLEIAEEEIPLDPNMRDQGGNTIMMRAVMNQPLKAGEVPEDHGERQIGIIEACNSRLASLDCQNNTGNTALHYCCQFGYEKAKEYLTKLGADQSLKNTEGRTASEHGDWHREQVRTAEQEYDERTYAMSKTAAAIRKECREEMKLEFKNKSIVDRDKNKSIFKRMQNLNG